ncbi:MAG TPA: STAS domain-containing protein [Planococcus sp. (in: firmicutes)]|nr:STAS domain-containing protein [Planococcus sp. (in: firmicutes)]
MHYEKKVEVQMISYENFTEYITSHSEPLALEVVDSVVQRKKLDVPDWEKEQAVAMYVELLGFFADSLTADEEDCVPESLIVWSKKNAEMQVSSGGRISEIVVRYPPTREVFNEMFTRISLELGLEVESLAFILKRINMMLDISLNETFFAFERLTDEKQAETHQELIKLSAPIVPIRSDLVVLPLIGYIDSYRVNHILENVIPSIAEMNVDHVITDFSGVVTIDAHIAQYLQQIGGTLRLMGIHVVVAGLRPDLVQTIVNSGIDLKATESFANVKQALDSIK